MLSLIPYPQQVVEGPGHFVLGETATVCFESSIPAALADFLSARLCQATDLTLPRNDDTPAIVFSISKRTRIHRGNEACELTVTPEIIRITGADESGLRHAVTTLLQLMVRTGEETIIPSVEIEDCPRYQWRGCHLDVARHFFDIDFIKKFIDLLALHKLNRFHWHLTDDQGWRIESKRYPRLTEIGAFRQTGTGERYGGFYTQDQIRAVIEYAALRGVTIVPEIDLPGHTRALLAAHPELSCTGGPFDVTQTWGIFDDVLCPGKDATYEFVESLLEELTGLFPGEYFHVGGDECPTVRFEHCPDCQALMKKADLGDVMSLQPHFTDRLHEILQRLGKRLVGWDEIAERDLPPDAIVMAWRGFDHGLAPARHGREVVMCPTSHCYFDYYQAESGEPDAIGGLLPLEKVYEFSPVPTGTEFPAADRIVGGQANVWTEYMATSEQVEYMTLPRLCALAERLWSPPGIPDFPEFRARLTAHLLRLERAGYTIRPL